MSPVLVHKINNQYKQKSRCLNYSSVSTGSVITVHEGIQDYTMTTQVQMTTKLSPMNSMMIQPIVGRRG